MIWKSGKSKNQVFRVLYFFFLNLIVTYEGGTTKKHKNTFSEVFQNAYTDAKPRKSSEKIVIFDDLGLVLV